MKRFTVVCERSETITSVRNVPERNEKGRQYRQYFLNLEDLHAGLEIKSKYADWFKNMSTYGFTENEDYMTVSKNLENGGRIIEHFISVDMAKQICMIQRNEKGRRCGSRMLTRENTDSALQRSKTTNRAAALPETVTRGRRTAAGRKQINAPKGAGRNGGDMQGLSGMSDHQKGSPEQ